MHISILPLEQSATHMEEVVGNLVQIENEQAAAKEEDLGQAASAAPTESCTEPATEGSQNWVNIKFWHLHAV